MNSIQPQSNIEAYQQALKELQELSNQTTLKIKEQINLFRSIQAANPNSKEIISGISKLMNRALEADRKIERIAQELLQTKLQINEISEQNKKKSQVLQEKEEEVRRLQKENEKITQEYQDKLQIAIEESETEIKCLWSDLNRISRMFLRERSAVEEREEKIERIKAKRTIKVAVAEIAEGKAYECAAESFVGLVESKAEFRSIQEKLARAKEKHQAKEEASSKKIENLMRIQEEMAKSHLEREAGLSREIEELTRNQEEMVKGHREREASLSKKLEELTSNQKEMVKSHLEREANLSKEIEELTRNQEEMVKGHREREASLSKKLEELIKSHDEDEEQSLQLLSEKDEHLASVQRENEKLKKELSELKSRKAKKVQSLKRKHAKFLEDKDQEIHKLKAKNERNHAKRQRLIEDCDQKRETIEAQKEALKKQGDDLEKSEKSYTFLKSLSRKTAQDYIKAHKELSVYRKEAKKVALQQAREAFQEAREKNRDAVSSGEEDEYSSMSDMDSSGENVTGYESSSNDNNDAPKVNHLDQGSQILILNDGDDDETDYLLMN